VGALTEQVLGGRVTCPAFEDGRVGHLSSVCQAHDSIGSVRAFATNGHRTAMVLELGIGVEVLSSWRKILQGRWHILLPRINQLFDIHRTRELAHVFQVILVCQSLYNSRT
jgi:hypothetical protein